MYTDNGFFPASPSIRRAVDEAARALRAMGAQVESFTPPDTARAVGFFLQIFSADGGAGFKSILGGEKPHYLVKGTLQGGTLPNWLRPLVIKIMEFRGQHSLAFILGHMGAKSTADYLRVVDERNAYRKKFLEALDRDGFEALICPPFALPALTHGSVVHLLAAAGYAVPYNVLGLPAGVVAATRVAAGEESDRTVSKDLADLTARKVEEGSAGLPVGVQVASRPWREDIVLAIMAGLEEHFRARPDYPAAPPL